MFLLNGTALKYTCYTLALIAVVVGVFGTAMTVLASAPGQLAPLNLEAAAEGEGKMENFGCPGEITGCLAYASYWVMMGMAWVAGIAGILLNFAVMETVVGMGQLVGELPAINVAWVVLRDIANVFLLFLTIFIGIATILGISGYSYKQLLWKVLLAAIFVNFSIFFTKVIIDVSNLGASEFYKLLLMKASPANAPECSKALQASNFSESPCLRGGIAGAFQSQLELMSIMNAAKPPGGAQNTSINTKIIFVGALGSLLFIIMTFIFGAAAFMLIGRFIVLVILIILSPIAFVMWVTKVGGGGGARWWNTLLNQAFFAPALFLMFWISYLMIGGMVTRFIGWDGATSSFSQAAAGNMSSMSILMFFTIAAGFLIGSLMIAKSMGAHGADAAMKTGKSWSRAASGAIAGAGFAYSAGLASRQAAMAYNRLQARAQETNEDGTFKRRGFSKALRSISGTSFDRGVAGGLGYAANKGILGTKGINDRFENARKANEARRGVINQTDAERKLEQALERVSRGGGTDAEKAADIRTIQAASAADLQRLGSDRFLGMGRTYTDNPLVQKALSGSQAEAFLKNSANLAGEKGTMRATHYADLRTAMDAAAVGTTLTREQEAARRNVTVRDIESNRDLYAKNPNEAQHWSEETFAAVMKNDSAFSDAEKKSFREARYNTALTAIKAPSRTDAQKQTINDMTLKALEHNRDVVAANPNFVSEISNDKFEKLLESKEFSEGEKATFKRERFAAITSKVPSLTPEKYEELLRSKVFTEAEKKTFRDVRASALKTAFGGSPDEIKKEANRLSQKDLENLDETILTDPRFLEHLKADKFADLVGKQSKLSPVVRDKMVVKRNELFTTMTATELRAAMASMDSAGVAGLPPTLLTQPHVMDDLDTRDMIEMAKKQSKGVLQTVRKHWELKYAPVKAKLAANPSAALTLDEKKAKQVGEWLESPGSGAIF